MHQIPSELPEFHRRYYKNILVSFFSDTLYIKHQVRAPKALHYYASGHFSFLAKFHLVLTQEPNDSTRTPRWQTYRGRGELLMDCGTLLRHAVAAEMREVSSWDLWLLLLLLPLLHLYCCLCRQQYRVYFDLHCISFPLYHLSHLSHSCIEFFFGFRLGELADHCRNVSRLLFSESLCDR